MIVMLIRTVYEFCVDHYQAQHALITHQPSGVEAKGKTLKLFPTGMNPSLPHHPMDTCYASDRERAQK